MDEADEAALAATRAAMATEAADRELYLAAIERYATDPEFHARAKRIEYLIVRAEDGTPSPDSRVGMWIGAAVALHSAELPVVKCPECLALVERGDVAQHLSLAHPELP